MSEVIKFAGTFEVLSAMHSNILLVRGLQDLANCVLCTHFWTPHTENREKRRIQVWISKSVWRSYGDFVHLTASLLCSLPSVELWQVEISLSMLFLVEHFWPGASLQLRFSRHLYLNNFYRFHFTRSFPFFSSVEFSFDSSFHCFVYYTGLTQKSFCLLFSISMCTCLLFCRKSRSCILDQKFLSARLLLC